MTTEATTVTAPAVHAATAGNRFEDAVRAAYSLGAREIRNVLRAPADYLPGLFIPIFFFFIQVGALSKFAEAGGVTNYKGFQLPVALLFASSNGGAGLNMVIDIESGYFEKLLLTPVSRLALLFGAMGADFARVFAQTTLVMIIALATGTPFAAGIGGAAVVVVLASLWGIVYSAIGFAIALKTGSPAATQSAFVLFFPLVFLTTSFAPLDKLSGWLATAARYNPVTYLLRGMRSLTMIGWQPGEIGVALIAIAGVGIVTMTMAFRSLLGRVR